MFTSLIRKRFFRRAQQIGLIALFAAAAMSLRAGAPTVAGKGVIEPQPAPAKDWEFTIGSYLWLAGIEADVSLGGFSKSSSVKAKDALSELDFGFATSLSARYKRFGALLDFEYLALSPSVETHGPLFSRADLSIEESILNLYGTFRVAEGNWGYVELMGGARHFWSDTDVTLREGILPRTVLGGRSSYWNAVGGLRACLNVTEKFFVNVYGDAGAGDLDLTWQAGGGLGYRFTDWLAATVGYRAMAFEGEKGNLDVDIVMHGFLLGLGITF